MVMTACQTGVAVGGWPQDARIYLPNQDRRGSEVQWASAFGLYQTQTWRPMFFPSGLCSIYTIRLKTPQEEFLLTF